MLFHSYGWLIPFFFLDINYWRGTKDNDSMQSDDASFWCKNRAKAETEARQYYQHGDVKKEEMRVKTNDFPEWEPAIVVRDLKKKFRKRIYNYVHSDSWGGALFFAAMPAALFGSAMGWWRRRHINLLPYIQGPFQSSEVSKFE